MVEHTGGLRERKKARTRAELQQHALRLIRDRGWSATTVDDIAAAAEVSRSTFFRYFATKEQVVLHDDVDALMVEAFAAQPAGTPLLAALRTAIREAFARLPDETRELEELRMSLARTVPEIAAAVRRQFTVRGFAAELARAVDRPADDPDVLVLAGVLAGARLAAQAMVELDPGLAYTAAWDDVLGRLEHGIPLAGTPIPAADGRARDAARRAGRDRGR